MSKTIPSEFKEMPKTTLLKYEKLKAKLKKMGKVLVAYSGGVDSAFLLKVAHDLLRENVLAVVAASETYSEREKKEALRLAKEMKIPHRVIHTRELKDPDFFHNPPQRCYFCKKELFSKLKKIAEAEGIPYILDGSNYEDRDDYRPGLKALKELDIHSPLKDVGLVKDEIRQLSRMLGLSTWNKPSMACLASRFPYYTEIDLKSLKQIDQAEEYLRKLGFSQFRVRHHNRIARIEISPDEFPKIIKKGTRENIVENFKKFGYVYVTLDIKGYRTGSMNEPLSSNEKRGRNR